jgi:hypothetical protein
LSEREIDFLMSHNYELSPKDPNSIARAVSRFLLRMTNTERVTLFRRVPGPQFSSASRRTAGATGVLDLEPMVDTSGPIVRTAPSRVVLFALRALR